MVGKAGPKSKARWNSHHYNLDNSTPSTFPKSIKKSPELFKNYFPNSVHSEIDGLNGEKRFLETTPDKVTLQGQTEYVNGIIQGESTAICGLWCKGELAGTAGVQNLHAKEGQDVTFGIFIFNKSFLGKGWGKVLVWAICRHLLDEEKIQVIRAAAKVENIASTASFLNVGFKVCTNDGIYNHMVFNAEDLIKPDKVQF